MDFVKWSVIWGALALAAAVLGAIAAATKRRDYSAWAAWCFLLPPLVFVVLVLPKNRGARPRRRPLDEEDQAA